MINFENCRKHFFPQPPPPFSPIWENIFNISVASHVVCGLCHLQYKYFYSNKMWTVMVVCSTILDKLACTSCDIASAYKQIDQVKRSDQNNQQLWVI